MEERRLDGNAAAGALAEIFPFDLTVVQAICAGCRSMDELATHVVYADAPGIIIRCVHCESVLLRVAHGGGRYWIDLRGVVCLQIDERATTGDGEPAGASSGC